MRRDPLGPAGDHPMRDLRLIDQLAAKTEAAPPAPEATT
jgi:hypothetical protein